MLIKLVCQYIDGALNETTANSLCKDWQLQKLLAFAYAARNFWLALTCNSVYHFFNLANEITMS